MSGASENAATTRRNSRDRKVKMGFAIVALVIMAAVYFLVQRSTPDLPEEWKDDLPAARATAKEQDRRLLLFVTSATSSQAAQQMKNITLSKVYNRKAIRMGKFVPVQVIYTNEIGEAYGVDPQKLPAMVIASPDGEVQKVRYGYIGEIPFRKEFLEVDVTESE
ncbi:MAG: thioredoxin family protein [Phycisphaerae bacterium]